MESYAFYNSHNDYMEHWERYERHNILQQRLITIIFQANWNKRIINSPNFILSNNDLKTHKNRFDRYIDLINIISKEMKLLNINYNKKRINKIKRILTKIRNYEN
tara:strand:+ start:263 stop:577 length:315 start_codon:yes stop_codon:yes gene_type:complete